MTDQGLTWEVSGVRAPGGPLASPVWVEAPLCCLGESERAPQGVCLLEGWGASRQRPVTVSISTGKRVASSGLGVPVCVGGAVGDRPPGGAQPAAGLTGPECALPLAHVPAGRCVVWRALWPLWPRRGRAAQEVPGSMPTAPRSAPGGPLCHHRLVLYVHASSTNLFSPQVRALPVCWASGWKGERGRSHGQGGRDQRRALFGAGGPRRCGFSGHGGLVFLSRGVTSWGSASGRLCTSSPSEWVEGGAISRSCVLPPSQKPPPPAHPPTPLPCPHLSGPAGGGRRGPPWGGSVEWGPGPGVAGAPPSPPHPRRQGPDSEWGALTVLQLLADPRVPHSASCNGGRGAAAGLHRLLCRLRCVQPRASGQRAEAP